MWYYNQSGSIEFLSTLLAHLLLTIIHGQLLLKTSYYVHQQGVVNIVQPTNKNIQQAKMVSDSIDTGKYPNRKIHTYYTILEHFHAVLLQKLHRFWYNCFNCNNKDIRVISKKLHYDCIAEKQWQCELILVYAELNPSLEGDKWWWLCVQHSFGVNSKN